MSYNSDENVSEFIGLMINMRETIKQNSKWIYELIARGYVV